MRYFHRVIIILFCLGYLNSAHPSISLMVNRIAEIGRVITSRVMFRYNTYQLLTINNSTGIIEYITNNPYLISAQLYLENMNIMLLIRNGSANQQIFADYIVPQFLQGKHILLYPVYDISGTITEYRCKTNITYIDITGQNASQNGQELMIFANIPSDNPLYKCQYFSSF